jgi:hypothetical protein
MVLAQDCPTALRLLDLSNIIKRFRLGTALVKQEFVVRYDKRNRGHVGSVDGFLRSRMVGFRNCRPSATIWIARKFQEIPACSRSTVPRASVEGRASRLRSPMFKIFILHAMLFRP